MRLQQMGQHILYKGEPLKDWSEQSSFPAN